MRLDVILGSTTRCSHVSSAPVAGMIASRHGPDMAAGILPLGS
jgi:hypothetical protein